MVNPEPNAEIVNDRFKLACHRLIARELGRDPAYLDEARAVVAPRHGNAGGEPFWIVEWRKLVARPVAEVRREITRRTDRMTLLRSGSPFPFAARCLLTDEQRIRLWRKIRATTRGS